MSKTYSSGCKTKKCYASRLGLWLCGFAISTSIFTIVLMYVLGITDMGFFTVAIGICVASVIVSGIYLLGALGVIGVAIAAEELSEKGKRRKKRK